jgi:predicted RNA-binding protein with RPS1 domain
LQNPRQTFPANRLVIGRIIKKQEDGKIDASLKESVIKYGYSLTLDTLEFGLTVDGCVTGYLKGKAVVSISGCRFRGLLKIEDYLEEVSESEQNIEKVLPIGTKVTAKIIKFKKEPKVKIKLGSKTKYFSNQNEYDAVTKKFDVAHVEELISSINSTVQAKILSSIQTTEVKLKSNIPTEKEQADNDSDKFETESEGGKIDEEDSEGEPKMNIYLLYFYFFYFNSF